MDLSPSLAIFHIHDTIITTVWTFPAIRLQDETTLQHALSQTRLEPQSKRANVARLGHQHWAYLHMENDTALVLITHRFDPERFCAIVCELFRHTSDIMSLTREFLRLCEEAEALPIATMEERERIAKLSCGIDTLWLCRELGADESWALLWILAQTESMVIVSGECTRDTFDVARSLPRLAHHNIHDWMLLRDMPIAMGLADDNECRIRCVTTTTPLDDDINAFLTQYQQENKPYCVLDVTMMTIRSCMGNNTPPQPPSTFARALDECKGEMEWLNVIGGMF